MGGELAAAGSNRGAITACVILATLMQALDTTIANVALPYMQGSVSASQDQIDWVLTSYIVAAAIMTPPTGFLAGRFGLKRLFLVSIAGFTVASMLCGMAQSLTQIVLFRVCRARSAPRWCRCRKPCCSAVYPRERQGFAMALFGIGVMIGPVLGPVLGGWLTENYSWRYVFYINLPIGILDLIGIMIFLPEFPRNAGAKLDWFGFGTLSIAIGALQVMLDRGEQLDWFGSGEIIIEAIVAASALYLFLVHTFTADNPFVRPAMFRDRNFAAGVLFIAVVGLTYYASMALQPPYLQELMDYPVVTAGLVMGPRGVGTMASMLIVGRLIGRVDTRILLAIGLALTAWSFNQMTGWTPDVSQATIIGVDHGPGRRSRLSVRAAERGDLVDAAARRAHRRRRLLQPVAQYRLERRHLGRQQPAGPEYPGQSRRHRAAVTAVNRGVRKSDHRACLESADGGRPRRARCRHHAAGADHRLYRRLQAADDRDARGDPAADGVQETVGRPRRRACRRGGLGRVTPTSVEQDPSPARWGFRKRQNARSVSDWISPTWRKALLSAGRGFPRLAAFGLLLRLEVLAGLLIDDLHRQPDLAALVEAEELDLHLVAFLDHVARLLHPARRQLADVHQAVLGAEEVHEGAEVHDLDDGAFVDVADFRLRGDRLDPVDRRLDRIRVGGCDLHRAVVLDVDLGAGLFHDLADHLAAACRSLRGSCRRES